MDAARPPGHGCLSVTKLEAWHVLSGSGAASGGALEAQVSLVLFSFDFLELSGSSLLKNDS